MIEEVPARGPQFLTQSKEGADFHEMISECLQARPPLSAEDTKIADVIAKSFHDKGVLPFQWTPQEENFISLQPRELYLPYLIYRYKFKIYPKEKTVADFPVYVLIEPISTCNLRCVMCFQIDKTFTRKPYMGLMPVDFYKKIIDEIVEGGTNAVTLASRGEPTLHPELGDMLEYASGKFFDLKLNTNATRLDEDMCHKILSSSVTELVFSIDAHEKPIYEEIRVRGDFDSVLANIRRFHEIREKHYPSSRLSTRISGVKFREDQNADGFMKFWSQIADHVVYVNIQNRWDTYNSPRDENMIHPCNYLWERFYVWFDGTCNPCDVDYKSKLSPGNLKDRSIREIWHSAEWSELRAAHMNMKRGVYNPCDRCGV